MVMTQTFSTNADNDIFLSADGNLSISTGITAVEQACATASKAQLGEMVLQTNKGIPNFQTVWIGNPNIAQFESALITTLLSVDGVNQVQALSTNATSGKLSYNATIKTQYGLGAVNG